MANPYAWSKETGEQNGSIDGDINFAEGQAPSSVNNSNRAEMGSHARFYEAVLGGLTTTGAGASYALATELTNPAVTYRTGLKFAFKAHVASLANATLNIDGQGPKPIFSANGVKVTAGALAADHQYEVKYDEALDTGNGGFVLFGAVSGAQSIPDPWNFVSGLTYGPNGEASLVYTGTQAQHKFATGTTEDVWDFDGTIGARLEPAGEDPATAQTIMTREKNDKRNILKVETEGTIASAATTDIGAEAQYRLNVTGTATITSFGTVANSRKLLRFSDVLKIELPGKAPVTTAAGDFAKYVSDGSGNWDLANYQRASGGTLAAGWTYLPSQDATSGTEFDWTEIPATAGTIEVVFENVSLTGNNDLLTQIGGTAIEATGYNSAGGFQIIGPSGTNGGGGASTAGFLIVNGGAINQMTLILRLSKVTANGRTWASEHDGLGGGAVINGGGLKTLSDTLTQVRVTATGSDSFDNGTLYVRSY